MNCKHLLTYIKLEKYLPLMTSKLWVRRSNRLGRTITFLKASFPVPFLLFRSLPHTAYFSFPAPHHRFCSFWDLIPAFALFLPLSPFSPGYALISALLCCALISAFTLLCPYPRFYSVVPLSLLLPCFCRKCAIFPLQMLPDSDILSERRQQWLTTRTSGWENA